MLGGGDNVDSIITEDEAKIYDRQIRLWGLDAQKRLRAAKVLIIGMGGLGSEVAKNIILAGVKSVHFMDDQNVSEKDLRCQIFVRNTDLGTNRATASLSKARHLNPMVEVTAVSSNLRQESLDFFRNFDVICANNLDWKTTEAIDNHCRKQGIKLFLGGCFGLYGYMLSDLGAHEYATEVKVPSQKNLDKSCPNAKVEDSETKIVRKDVEFSSLKDVFAFKWSGEGNIKNCPTGFFFCRVISDFISKMKRVPELENKENDEKILGEIRTSVMEELSLDDRHLPINYLEECYGEISPPCAVVGGIIAQDVLKVVSQKDQPHNNFFFLDGILGCGTVDKISGP